MGAVGEDVMVVWVGGGERSSALPGHPGAQIHKLGIGWVWRQAGLRGFELQCVCAQWLHGLVCKGVH